MNSCTILNCCKYLTFFKELFFLGFGINSFLHITGFFFSKFSRLFSTNTLHNRYGAPFEYIKDIFVWTISLAYRVSSSLHFSTSALHFHYCLLSINYVQGSTNRGGDSGFNPPRIDTPPLIFE